MDTRLADILGPTLRNGPGAIVASSSAGPRIAVVPLRVLGTDELTEACLIYAALHRGLLVVA